MKHLVAKIIDEVIQYRYHYLLLILFILLSAYIRYVPLMEGNFPFLFDHGRDLMAVKEIVIEGNQTLIGPFTGLQGVFHGALHYYLLTIPFILTGGNPASPTYFLATLFLVGVLATYLLLGRIFNRQTALIAALFFALAAGSLNATKHFWNPYWIPFIMVFWVAILYSGIFRKKNHLIVAFFLAGIMAQCDIAFGVVLIPAMIVLMLVFNRSLFVSKQFLLALGAFAVTFATHLIFDIRNKFLMTNAIINLLQGKNTSLGFPIEFPDRLYYRLDEIQDATVLALSGNANLAYVLFGILLAALVYVIIFRKWSDLRNLTFLLLIPITYFIFFLIYSRAAWSWYWVGLQVPYYFAVAYSLWIFYQNIPKLKPAILIILALFTVIPLIPGSTEFLKTEPGIYNNEMRAIHTAFNDANGQPFSLFFYTPPIYTYQYDYLAWWYAKRNNIPAPAQNKDQLFYLILEEDKQNPDAPKGWKETVIKEGKTIWIKKLPGNLTVERREGNGYKK